MNLIRPSTRTWFDPLVEIAWGFTSTFTGLTLIVNGLVPPRWLGLSLLFLLLYTLRRP